MSTPNREASDEGGGGGPHWLDSAALRMVSIWDANYCGVQCVTISRQPLSTSLLFFSCLSFFVCFYSLRLQLAYIVVACSVDVFLFVTSAGLSIVRTSKRAPSLSRSRLAVHPTGECRFLFRTPFFPSFPLFSPSHFISLGVKARMTSSCASPTAASWSSTGFSSV